jgi:hypothetical protein
LHVAFAPFAAPRLLTLCAQPCSRAAVPTTFARCGAAATLLQVQALQATAPRQQILVMGADFWRAAAPVRSPMACFMLQMPLLERSCDERCGVRRVTLMAGQYEEPVSRRRARAGHRISPHFSARAAAEAESPAQVG